MRVLGITAGIDSGAAVVEDGRILAAVNEERLCRMKLVTGFPRGSIAEVLRLSNTRASKLDAVMVATNNSIFIDDLEPFVEGFRHAGNHSGLAWGIKRAASTFSRFHNKFPMLEKAYCTLLAPTYMQRRKAIRRVLREEFDIQCPIKFVDHHFAHVTSAYFTSGFEDALVVWLDGGGDRLSSRVYAARNGKMESLH